MNWKHEIINHGYLLSPIKQQLFVSMKQLGHEISSNNKLQARKIDNHSRTWTKKFSIIHFKLR